MAETKGNVETMNLRPIENFKIRCAEKHFKLIAGADFVYKKVNYPTTKGGCLQLDFSTAFGFMTTALQNAALLECLKAETTTVGSIIIFYLILQKNQGRNCAFP